MRGQIGQCVGMLANEIAASKAYWNGLAEEYQATEVISVEDYHHGPLLPGDRQLGLLPADVAGLRCLEVGSGAAQNSVYLAGRGGVCTATDVSASQLSHAQELAQEKECDLHTIACPMEQLSTHIEESFDLVHSSGALCFSADPAEALRQMAARLKPGGVLVLSTLHPLAFAEWLEVEEDGFGVFLKSYFEPPAEVAGEEGLAVAARTWPLSRLLGWVREAGLRDPELWEPPAATSPEDMPYRSEIWLEHLECYSHIPLMVVLRAHKPAG